MLFNSLNEAQKRAAVSTEGYNRVIAGAGSGKTRVIVARYLYLVKECGINPENILCITFTNKAAGEIRKRIIGEIGLGYGISLICTYHGFGAKIIRENPEKLFLTKEFQIIDQAAQSHILDEIYRKYELKMDYATFQNIQRKITKIKQDKAYIPRMMDANAKQILASVSDQDDMIIEDYLQRSKATYSLDFNDLILMAIYMLENFEDVRERWQKQLEYVQVDEFQDSTANEMRLVDLVQERYGNLMVVGDPDQNIYEWRGSDMRILVDFDKEHSPVNDIFLNQNYRSTPQILACANSLIEHNNLRIRKELFTQNPSGAPCLYVHTKNDDKEAAKIVEMIKAGIIKERRRYSDFAVLYRSSFLSRKIESKFIEQGIPYEIFGNMKFYQRMEILDVIAFLRLVVFDDNDSFKRIINKPRRKFGVKKVIRLEKLMEETGSSSAFDTLSASIGDSAFKGSNAPDFVRFVNDMRNLKNKIPISELVNRVCQDSGYEAFIRELGDEERLEDLQEFKVMANEYERDFGESVSAEEFLNNIALSQDMEERGDADNVKMMTIHASKGLEFPYVFIVGLSEGIFPSNKTIEERKEIGLEEERRLCYVAITRAMEKLVLMDNEGYSQGGSVKKQSIFLQEIGESNYKTIGKVKEDLKASSSLSLLSGNNDVRTERSEDDESVLKPHTRVNHHVFGAGEVLSYDGKRGFYEVKFDGFYQPRNISRGYFDKRSSGLQSHALLSADDQSLPLLSQPGKPSRVSSQPDIASSSSVPVPCVSERQASRGAHGGNWICTGITDLGRPSMTCQLCNSQTIRYVHHMFDGREGRQLDCGCVCAGKLEGDSDSASRRESDFKNWLERKSTFIAKQWKVSKNGNEYAKIKDNVCVLFRTKNGKWKYYVNRQCCQEEYSSPSEAKSSCFDKVDPFIVRTDKC